MAPTHASVVRNQADQLAYGSLITMLLTLSHHDPYCYRDAAEDKAIEPNRYRLPCRVTSDAVVVSSSPGVSGGPATAIGMDLE